MNRSTRIPASSNGRLSRRSVLRAAVSACGAAAGAAFAPPFARVRAQPATRIETFDLGGLSLLQGAGCNVVAMRGDGGALMVDGGLARNADTLLEAVYAATGNEQVALLINTHWHPEQTGANTRVGSTGGTVLAHEKTLMYLSHAVRSALFPGRLEPLPQAGLPTEITRSEGTLQFGGQTVDYGYLPAAHTDGDLYVYFKDRDVLAAGGVVAADRWPLLDYRNGAWFGGRVRALEWLAELANPQTRVVPADGPLLTGADIVRQRDMYQALFETMIGYMNMGLGAEDVVARNPLREYQAEFGDAASFLDGAYRSMMIAYVPD